MRDSIIGFSVSHVHRETIIYIEQAPATAGAIFLQVTRPGGSVPFCRRRFETAPRETGAHCVSPLPHTPTPGILPAGEKKKGDFLKSGEKGERKIDQTIIGIDHGYYAMKTRHCVFPTGITAYDHEPYTRQDVLEYEGRWYVCGTGRQPLQRDKTASENYYLLTLAAIAKELRQRRMKGQCSATLAAGLPLTGFGREKGAFEKYLRRSSQPVKYRYEDVPYEVTVTDVKLFPQGYSALALHPELITGEPSVLLMDIGGWTVDLMRLDNAVPNADTCRSLEWGMIRCLDGAREQVRRTMGLSVTDAQIERVLSGLPCALDEKAREVIRQQGRIYTEHLLSAVMEAGFDLKAMPVVILGGGASVVTRYVREDDRLCRMIPLHDSRINAAGFERLAEQMNVRGQA